MFFFRLFKKRGNARWSSRAFRKQRALSKVANTPSQTKMIDYFDTEKLSEVIDAHDSTRTAINNSFGINMNDSVKPILKKLLENAERNSQKKSAKGFRRDVTIKKFASCLFCLIGKAAYYEMLQQNLGCALPSVDTLNKNLAKGEKIKEGEFRFDELVKHLKHWNCPMGVHIQLDDTRILQRVEYDQVTDHYVGFCLPIKDGLPGGDSFILDTFEDLQTVFNTNSCVSYAHCIVAKPVNLESTSFVLFVLGTDSKYSHCEIESRWKYITNELSRRGVCVYSNGADGAGPFLKAMIEQSGLFKVSKESNIPKEWTFL